MLICKGVSPIFFNSIWNWRDRRLTWMIIRSGVLEYSRIKRRWIVRGTNGFLNRRECSKIQRNRVKRKRFKLEWKWFCKYIHSICWALPRATKALIPTVTARNFARSEPVAKPIQAVRNALSFENRTKQNAYRRTFHCILQQCIILQEYTEYE